MAEKGAYLTGTTLIKPSIFEIIAQESLASTLEPTFKKIFWFCVSCNPERYGYISRWADEAYLIFNVFLQRYYFSKYSASFSESFYGLKRVSATSVKDQRDISAKQRIISLALTVLVPYLRNKLTELNQEYVLQVEDASSSKLKKWYQLCLVQAYTVSCTLYESITLYTHLLYLAGKSIYPTPLMQLLRLTLTYANAQPNLTITELLKKIKTNTFHLSDGVNILEQSVTMAVEVSAFFLQFLAWWSQEENYSNMMALPVPAPPKIPQESAHYKGICPVCLREQHIKTVLSVSGYIFCYQCILLTIRRTGRCPVTSYPATEDDLIRIYV